MANLHIRGLDEEIASRLKDEAARRGLSVNALVLNLLHQGVGLRQDGSRRLRYHDLDDLAGTWTKEEAESFLSAISDFEQVDDLWK